MSGKFGDFLGCSSYPTCKWVGNEDENGNIVEKKVNGEITDHECPKCKSNVLIKRSGKFGDFFGCKGYPKCKTIMNVGEDGEPVAKKTFKKKTSAPAKPTGITCPQCNDSELVIRKSKFGNFTACSGFPKCKYIKPKE